MSIFKRKPTPPPVPDELTPLNLPETVSFIDQKFRIYGAPNFEIYVTGQRYTPIEPVLIDLILKIRAPFSPTVKQTFTVEFDNPENGKQKALMNQRLEYRDSSCLEMPGLLSTNEEVKLLIDRRKKAISIDLKKRNAALNVMGKMNRISKKSYWNGQRDSRGAVFDTTQLPPRVLALQQLAERAMDDYMKRKRIRADLTGSYQLKELSTRRKFVEGQSMKKSMAITFSPLVAGNWETINYYVIYQMHNGEMWPVALERRD